VSGKDIDLSLLGPMLYGHKDELRRRLFRELLLIDSPLFLNVSTLLDNPLVTNVLG